ncbi:MAG: hemolysin III family protein [Actinobacteria bacterium]|nr:hemolysin III family protein [Actinomycetota bacterium]
MHDLDEHGATSPPPTGAHPRTELFDSTRSLYYLKPTLRGWMHLLWFEAALVAGTLLIRDAHGVRPLVAAVVYASAVAGLFGTSALYHRGEWSAVWSARLQRLDHGWIFVVIAASATPIFLLTTPGTTGVIGLLAIWLLAGAALLTHLLWMDAPERIVGGSFLALGAGGSVAIAAVWMHAGVLPAVLLAIGSLLHATGAVSYHRRQPDPIPAVFGYHEVFHTYVCVAVLCQYIAIAMIIT